jgi:CRISPR-associated endonuclease Csn1
MDLDRRFPKNGFPDPYPGYRDDLWGRLRTLIVSHKPDHGLPPGAQDDVHQTAGRLHEQTAYGQVAEEIDGKRFNLVTRKPLAELSEEEIGFTKDERDPENTKTESEKKLAEKRRKKAGQIRDDRLRDSLQTYLARARKDEGELDKARLRKLLEAFGKQHGIYRARILKTAQSVRTVRHTDSVGQTFEKAYAPGENHRVEIFELPDGSWQGEGVTMHDANQPGYRPTWPTEYPEARLVMRLHPGDCVDADFDGVQRRTYRVHRLEPSKKRVRLALHYEGGRLQNRHADPNDSFRWIFATWENLQSADGRGDPTE